MSGPLVILHVEDNPDHAELVRRCLAEHPLASRLFHVPDGEAALDYLSRRGGYADPLVSPVPQVIFLDLRLPKVDGLEVLEHLKADPDLARIPVVVLTTSDAERDLQKAYDFQVNSYLVKPVDFEQFTGMIHDMADYWLKWNIQPAVKRAD